jgi:hypothetical protein
MSVKRKVTAPLGISAIASRAKTDTGRRTALLAYGLVKNKCPLLEAGATQAVL